MKILLVAILLSVSASAFAAEKTKENIKAATRVVAESADDQDDFDCKEPRSQMEIGICANEAAERTLNMLKSSVYRKCAKSPSILAFKGGTGYSSALLACEADLYHALRNHLKTIKLRNYQE